MRRWLGCVLALAIGVAALVWVRVDDFVAPAPEIGLPLPVASMPSMANTSLDPPGSPAVEVAAVPAPRRDTVPATAAPLATLRIKVRRGDAPVVSVPCMVVVDGPAGMQTHDVVTGPDGDAVLALEAPGVAEVRIDELDRRSVDLSAVAETVVEFALDAALRIEGTVEDATGVPVAGAMVEAIRHADWPVPDRRCVVATSDAEGRFVTTCVGGPWVLRAQRAGQASALVAPGSGDGAVLGDGRARVRLVLEPPAVTVRGRVFRDDGSAVSAGHVTLLTARTTRPDLGTGRSIDSARVAADGAFEVHARCGGAAELRVSVPDCGPQRVTLTLPEEGEIDVVARVSPAARLEGRVLDTDGTPVPGARVRACEPGRADALTETRARPDGTFALGGLPSTTPLIVFALSPLHETERFSVPALGQPVSEHDFALVPLAVIRGRLVRADGTPLPRWRVEVRVRGERTQRDPVMVDADGAFVVGVQHGVGAQLFAIPVASTLRVSLAGGAVVSPTGATARTFVVAASDEPSAYVVGRLLLPSDVSPAGVAVFPFDGTTRGRNLHRNGADGSFTLGPLPPRSYRILARPRGGQEHELARVMLAPGDRVDLGDVVCPALSAPPVPPAQRR